MNKINFISDVPPVFKISKDEISHLVKNCLTEFNINNQMIEIWFTSEQQIKELNAKHRQIDKPTDVLSFPQSPQPGKYQVLGSLVISSESVIRKKEDIVDVIKHGLLHLLGYDHDDLKKEKGWESAAIKIKCNL